MVQFSSFDENPDNFSEAIETYVGSGVEGLVVAPCLGGDAAIKRAVDASIPVVLVDREAQVEGVGSVLLDNEQAGRLIVGHLFRNGYKRIEIIANNSGLSSIDKRVKGYMNFDMIGRDCVEGRPNHFTLMHAPKDSVFTAWLNSDIAQYSLALDPQFKTGEDFNNGSDQVPFFKAGIPFVWYQTGGHPDFHMPTDETSRINWNKMVEITKASFLCLWKMANNP